MCSSGNSATTGPSDLFPILERLTHIDAQFPLGLLTASRRLPASMMNSPSDQHIHATENHRVAGMLNTSSESVRSVVTDIEQYLTELLHRGRESVTLFGVDEEDPYIH